MIPIIKFKLNNHRAGGLYTTFRDTPELPCHYFICVGESKAFLAKRCDQPSLYRFDSDNFITRVNCREPEATALLSMCHDEKARTISGFKEVMTQHYGKMPFDLYVMKYHVVSEIDVEKFLGAFGRTL